MEIYLEIAKGAVDLSKQRELMGRAETSVVNICRHADDVDLTHQGWQLCDCSGLTEADEAPQHCGVSRTSSSPLLMRMQECDEVQVGAAQLVNQPGYKGPNMLLIHVCQRCAEIAVVAIAHTLGCLQKDKLQI